MAMARLFLENKLGFGSVFKVVKAGVERPNLYVKFKGKEYPVKSPRVRDAERLLCRLRGEDARSEKTSEGPGAKPTTVSVSELLMMFAKDIGCIPLHIYIRTLKTHRGAIGEAEAGPCCQDQSRLCTCM